MKKFTLTLVFLLSLSFSTFANYSKLTIVTYDNADFYVLIDNQTHYSNSNNKVVIKNINSGNHYFEVYRINNHYGNANSNTNNASMVYSGNLNIYSNYHLKVKVTSKNRLKTVFNNPLNTTNTYTYGSNTYYNNNNGYNGYSGYNNYNSYNNNNNGYNGYNNYNGYNSNNGYNNNNGHNNNNGYNGYNSYNNNNNNNYNNGNSNNHNKMNNAEFNNLLSTINNTSFDDTKLSIAKSAIANNRMSANQILSVCNTFTFESTKLSFAKFAYPYCTNKNSYYLVNNTFTFSSSINELTNYISRY